MTTDQIIARAERRIESKDWGKRHIGAAWNPKANERPILDLIRAWGSYADQHRAQFETSIGEDSVLGPAWLDIGGGMIGLLNGDLGRLDGGVLDGLIREIAVLNGFDSDQF